MMASTNFDEKDTTYIAWAIILILTSFAVGFSYSFISISFGDTILNIANPLTILRKLIDILVWCGTCWMFFKILKRKISFALILIAPFLLIGFIALGSVLFSYSKQTYALLTEQYYVITGKPIIIDKTNLMLYFSISEQEFKVMRRSINDFAGEANWDLLTSYPQIRVGYTDEKQIIQIIGLPDNDILQPLQKNAAEF